MNSYTLYPAKNINNEHAPKATLLIIHGMAEHQKRYVELADYLSAQGIVVMTFDNLGHGQQAYDSHGLGYIGQPDPAEQMIAYTLQHADLLAEQYPHVPHLMLGFSMGSFIARILLHRYNEKFDGAILIGTASANLMTASVTQMTQTLNLCYPSVYNPILHYSIGGLFNAKFWYEPNIKWLNWLNSNPDEVKKFIADPLCGFCFTNNGYYALMQLMALATALDWADSIAKEKPMLFLSGEDDVVGQMGKSLPILAKDLKQQGFEQVNVKQYPNMRHDILREPNNLQVYEDILNWIQSIKTLN